MPTTMYDDPPTVTNAQPIRAVCDEIHHSSFIILFAGRRYREHAQRGSHILLFVRRRKQDERRITAPYTFLGPATYVTHQGKRPMSITRRLHHRMPAELFDQMKVAAG